MTSPTGFIGQSIYNWSHIVVESMIKSIAYSKNIKYEVSGKENIPKGNKPVIFSANHSGPVDFYILGKNIHFDSMDHMLIGTSYYREIVPPYKMIHFFTLKKFFDPESALLARKYNNWTEQIPFSNEKKVYKKAMETAKRFLNERKNIAVFSSPAGNGTQSPSKIPARLALETNTNIMPVCISILGKNGKKPESMFCKDTSKICVAYKPLVDVAEFKKQHAGENDGGLVKLLTDLVWQKVYGD
jgi:hypothetical protein